MTEELKPCPFCGGRGVLLFKRVNEEMRYKVFCRKCGVGTMYENQETSVIAKWNSRHTVRNGLRAFFRFFAGLY